MGFSASHVLSVINKKSHSFHDLDILISKEAELHLESLAKVSAEITRLRFGNTIALYAPLYISNHCVNNCAYCGFSIMNTIPRVTLKLDEIIREAEILKKMGFGHILLLSGEAPGALPLKFLKEVIVAVKKIVPHVSVEIYPLSENEYKELVFSGCDGITVYQESYNRKIYKEVHLSGPKSDFEYRYSTPMAAARAGMRGVGLGFLMGLAPWRDELRALVSHGRKVLENDWKVKLAFSFPRLRPHSGSYEPAYPVSDSQLAHMLFVLRLLFPDAELVISTRESSEMRDGLLPLGVTRMSAGSSTQPGGYSQDNKDGEQFSINDNRSPQEIAKVIEEKGFEPVWKDWDWAYNGINK
jgi:2-iminoacetate synthase